MNEGVAAQQVGVLATIDRWVGRGVEIACCALVVIEIGILLAGVVWRYGFGQPLIWTDELASIIFVWLSCFGAVLALRRGQHMRLTAFINALAPDNRNRADVWIAAVVLLFLACLLPSAIDYAIGETIVRTPALDISYAWRASAVGAGCFLMSITATIQLFFAARTTSKFLFILAGVLLVAGAIHWSQPYLMPIGNYNLLLFFVVAILFLIFSGVPIAFAFGIATVFYTALCTNAPLTVLIGRLDEGMSHLVLLSIPMFIFLGLLIEMTGMAAILVNLLVALIGHIRGGLSYVLLGAMVLVSGISGAKAADMAAVAPVLFPEMKRRGARPGELVAQLAASGAMAETIPPSLVLIMIGSVTGVSIAALFTGGLLPALVLAVALGIVAYFRSDEDDPAVVKRFTIKQIGRLFLIALPALVLPFIIRAAVVEGVATATEVSTIGIVYAAAVGLILYRQFDWYRLMPMLAETAALSGAILIIIGSATAMAWALTQSGFSRQIVQLMSGLPGGAFTFWATTIALFVVLGSILEGIPALLLLAPLLFPIARLFGIHEVQYAMVVILSMGVGLFAPPFGVGFFTACAIGRVDPDEAMTCIWPYLGALLVGVIIVAAVPWLSVGFL